MDTVVSEGEDTRVGVIVGRETWEIIAVSTCTFLEDNQTGLIGISASGDLAQMVERSLSMREALGSMPRFSTFFSNASLSLLCIQEFRGRGRLSP